MNHDSQLHPENMRAQSNEAISRLQAESDHLNTSISALNAFINDDENRGRSFSNFRQKMRDLRRVAEAFIRANDADIADHIRIIASVGNEVLIGAVTLHTLQISTHQRDAAQSQVEHYANIRNDVTALQRLNPFDWTHSNARKSQRTWERLRDNHDATIQEMNRQIEAYNSITQATSGLFAAGKEIRLAAKQGLEFIQEAASGLPDSYNTDALNAWRDDMQAIMEQHAQIEEQLAKELAGITGFSLMGFDPVNMSTGNFIYSKEDLSVPGRYPLTFKRFYNSIGGTESAVGTNWTHNYNIYLSEKEEAVHITLGDGHVEVYKCTEDGKYAPPISSNLLLLKTDEGWELSTRTNDKYCFNKEGYLQRIIDPNDNETTFIYTDNLLTSVSNPCGSLSFEYDDRQIVKVTDHAGREVRLEYQGKLLRKATHPTGAEYNYGYDPCGNLSKVTNPLGVDAIINKYDSYARMVRQSFADGGVAKLSYADNIITATEQNGNVIKYERDSKYRTTRIIYADSEERYEYNEQYKRTKHVDRNGNMSRIEYDESGNITKVIDPLRNETTIEYNEFNKPIKITTPIGGTATNEYNAVGDLTAVTDPLGFVTKLINNKQGLVTEVILPDESSNKLKYDNRGNILSIADKNNNETKYEYDELNRVVKSTDPMGNITSFEYNENSDISKATNADGNCLKYEYDASGKLIKLLDFAGGVEEYKYNSVGKLEETVNPSGEITKIEYDLMWNVTSVTDPIGNKVSYEYDRHQRVIKTIDEEGCATRYEHDKNGNVTAVINPMGGKTKIKYDALNRRIEVREPDGVITKFEYDGVGNVTKITDPQGGEILRVYNKAGQLTSISNQLNNTTKYSYTCLGQLETVTDAIGGITAYSYYPGGKLKALTYPGGEVETYEYDKNWNVTKITDILGSVTQVFYDCLGRITKITNALGHNKQFGYDSLSNITSITDENGNETIYRYSPTGELIEVIDALGHSTKYNYDKVGRMTRMEQYRVIDETYAELKQMEMQVTAWERNKRGEVVSKSTPLGGETHYKYDPLGNLISQVDEDKMETLYEYNLASKLKKITYADGKTVELKYNPLRQLTELKDWLGTTAIELDALGRATKVTDHDDNVVEYAWDNLGRRESITYPDKTKVDYTYDISGRIKSVASETGTTHYTYSIADRLIERIMPDNFVTQQKADQLGRIESLTHTKNNEILDSFKYSYDPASNITQIVKHRKDVESDSGIFNYAYDKLGRLTEATSNHGSAQYHYDSLGNRIISQHDGVETKHSYNARNQLIKTTENDIVKDYSYDGRGNLTSIVENGINKSAFIFNAANRMVEAITQKGKAEYGYNGFLQRVSKLETLQNADIQDPLNEVKYTLDLTKPYDDLLAMGNQRFIWGNELLQSEGVNKFSYLNDHLGSPIRLMGENQDEVLAYDEFGVPTVTTSRSSSIFTTDNPFGFTGYQSDNISDLNYAQARYYTPTLGRFSAQDTHWNTENMIFGDERSVLGTSSNLPNLLAINQSKNSYVYVANNPIAYVDRNGKIIISALIVGIVVGVVVGGTTAGVRAHANDENVVAAVFGGAVVGAAVGAFSVVAAPKVAAVVGGGALTAATATSVASGALNLANHQIQGMINHDDNQAPHITESLRAAGTAMITTFFGSLIAAPLTGAIDPTDVLAPVAYTVVALFTDGLEIAFRPMINYFINPPSQAGAEHDTMSKCN